MKASVSLAQLLLAVTIWSVFIAAILAPLSGAARLLTIVAGFFAVSVVFAKCSQPLGVGLLVWPLLCLVNLSSFHVALGFAFGDTSAAFRLTGLFAFALAWPVVIVGSCVPLAGYWDTLFGVVVVSLLETAGLLFLQERRRRNTQQT